LRGWLLDTNVVSELMRPAGERKVIDWAAGQPEDRLFISILTLAEFDHGIHNLATGSSSRARFEAALRAVELRFLRCTLSVSDAVIRCWGRLGGEIRQATGRPPPVIDTLLAATAIEHDLCLATRNVKDVANTGAAIFNPWTDDPRMFAIL
jgi:predicted nucleic acid-binding protein